MKLIYYPSKIDFGFVDKKASKIWGKIEENRKKDGFFSKKRYGSSGEFYLGDFGDFKVYLDTEGDKGELFEPIIFVQSSYAKKLKIPTIEKHLKNLTSRDYEEDYVLKSASNSNRLLLLGSVTMGGVQWNNNPGYIYAMSFIVSKDVPLIISIYCKYGIKILSDFCEEAKLNIF